MKHHIFKIDNLIKIIPGTILFYSFIYIHAFHDSHNLDVVSIYSIEELLLSFIPIIRPLFALLMVGLIFPLGIYFSTEYFDMSAHVQKVKTELETVKMSNGLNALIRLIISLIIAPFGLFFIAWGITSILFSFMELVDTLKAIGELIANVFLSISIYQGLVFLSHINPRLRKQPTFSIIIVIAFFVGAKFFDSFGRAVAEGSYSESIYQFYYEGKEFQSGNQLVILADTKNFIVLRDKTCQTNLFFEREKISNLRVQK